MSIVGIILCILLGMFLRFNYESSEKTSRDAISHITVGVLLSILIGLVL